MDMEVLEIWDVRIVPCSTAPGRYDVFRVSETESKVKDEYIRSVAYGVTLERAAEVCVEVIGFERSEDLRSFIDEYKKLKDELLSKMREFK